MAHYPAADHAVFPRMNVGASDHSTAVFLEGRLVPLLDLAGLDLQAEDYLALEGEAAYLASCARVLGHGFLAEVAGMLTLAACNREAERCELFLSVIRREWHDKLVDH